MNGVHVRGNVVPVKKLGRYVAELNVCVRLPGSNERSGYCVIEKEVCIGEQDYRNMRAMIVDGKPIPFEGMLEFRAEQ